MKTDTDFTVPAVAWKILAWSLSAVLACATGYAALWMDARNDRRYVQLASYLQDRERDKELRDVKQETTDRKLAEISADVKTLLRESRK